MIKVPLWIRDLLKQDGSRSLTADWDIGDGHMIKADKIRARDGAGLALYEDGGAGIFVKDGGSIGVGTVDPGVFKMKLDANGVTPCMHIKRDASGVLNESNNEHMSMYLEVESANAMVSEPLRGLKVQVDRNTGSSGYTHSIDGGVRSYVDSGEHAGVTGFGYAYAGTGSGCKMFGGDFHAVRQAVAGDAGLRGIEVGVHPRLSSGSPGSAYGITLHNQKNWGNETSYKAGYGLYIYGETNTGWGFDWPIRIRSVGDLTIFAINGDGDVGIKTASPAHSLAVNRKDDDGVVIDIEQDDAVEGTISVSGNTVSYNAFMGAHFTQFLPEQKIPKVGAIVIATGEIIPCELHIECPEDEPAKKTVKEVCGVEQKEYFSYVELASQKADKRVYGVYHAKMCEDSKGQSFGEDTKAIHQIAALGLYKIRVTDTNGDIVGGDYIQSSIRDGEGERQDDDIMHNYTVAKSIIDVKWNEVEVDSNLGYKWMLIPATLHAG